MLCAACGMLITLLRRLPASCLQASRPKAPDTGVSTSTSSGSAAATSAPDKPAHDVVAGAMARAASQSTIHPLDTMKVRMQAGRAAQISNAAVAKAVPQSTKPGGGSSIALSLQRGLAEVGSLYKGVVSAATGAGIIIGAYFAFYSTTKRFLREQTEWKEGKPGSSSLIAYKLTPWEPTFAWDWAGCRVSANLRRPWFLLLLQVK